jgi:hypothetical protein
VVCYALNPGEPITHLTPTLVFHPVGEWQPSYDRELHPVIEQFDHPQIGQGFIGMRKTGEWLVVDKSHYQGGHFFAHRGDPFLTLQISREQWSGSPRIMKYHHAVKPEECFLSEDGSIHLKETSHLMQQRLPRYFEAMRFVLPFWAPYKMDSSGVLVRCSFDTGKITVVCATRQAGQRSTWMQRSADQIWFEETLGILIEEYAKVLFNIELDSASAIRNLGWYVPPLLNLIIAKDLMLDFYNLMHFAFTTRAGGSYIPTMLPELRAGIANHPHFFTDWEGEVQVIESAAANYWAFYETEGWKNLNYPHDWTRAYNKKTQEFRLPFIPGESDESYLARVDANWNEKTWAIQINFPLYYERWHRHAIQFLSLLYYTRDTVRVFPDENRRLKRVLPAVESIPALYGTTHGAFSPRNPKSNASARQSQALAAIPPLPDPLNVVKGMIFETRPRVWGEWHFTRWTYLVNFVFDPRPFYEDNTHDYQYVVPNPKVGKIYRWDHTIHPLSQQTIDEEHIHMLEEIEHRADFAHWAILGFTKVIALPLGLAPEEILLEILVFGSIHYLIDLINPYEDEGSPPLIAPGIVADPRWPQGEAPEFPSG